MALATSHHLPLHDSLDDALQGAREALERLRATLAEPRLPDADPTRQFTEPGARGEGRARVRR